MTTITTIISSRIAVLQELTHWESETKTKWPLQATSCIFLNENSWISWIKIFEFRLKFHSDLFLGVHLTMQYASIGSDNTLLPNMRQTITWTSDGFIYWLIAWRHRAANWTNVDLSSARFSAIHPIAICLSHHSLKSAWKLLIWNVTQIPQWPLS